MAHVYVCMYVRVIRNKNSRKEGEISCTLDVYIF
jgi:hypothetical protein